MTISLTLNPIIFLPLHPPILSASLSLSLPLICLFLDMNHTRPLQVVTLAWQWDQVRQAGLEQIRLTHLCVNRHAHGLVTRHQSLSLPQGTWKNQNTCAYCVVVQCNLLEPRQGARRSTDFASHYKLVWAYSTSTISGHKCTLLPSTRPGTHFTEGGTIRAHTMTNAQIMICNMGHNF